MYEKIEQIATEIMRSDLPIEYGRRELAEHLFSQLLTDPDGIPLINEAAIRHLERRLEQPFLAVAEVSRWVHDDWRGVNGHPPRMSVEDVRLRGPVELRRLPKHQIRNTLDRMVHDGRLKPLEGAHATHIDERGHAVLQVEVYEFNEMRRQVA